MNPISTNNRLIKLYLIRYLILLSGWLAIAGCAAIRSNMATQPDTAALDSAGNSYYHFILSEMENRNDQTDQAINSLEKAVDARPESVYLKKELIYLQLKNNNIEEALETAEAILADHPEEIETLIIAATIKKQTGRDEEAASYLKKFWRSTRPRKKYIMCSENITSKMTTWKKRPKSINK